ncbi:MFS transporter [Nocardia crassostreae]|uniref:MFS transporter n=1 Tax=Nocardia crassostreae TaxID=53428 RepID=UPI00082B78D1|nr:MFS transporter [Nocardia crassostreae]
MTALTSAPERATVRGWLAVLAVTLGIFSLMTSELLPVGLLTPVGSALNISEGAAGLMVTVPGLVAAFSAPLITILTGRIDRRIMLVALIALMGAANLASSMATSFTVILIARFLIGIAVGGFWSIAGSIALRLVPEHQVGRATAVIFGGVETASVFGVPTGTFIGDLSGWRAAFAVVGLLGLVSVIAMAFLLPSLPAQRTIGFADLPKVFGANATLRAALALTFLVITGHFLAYTFVRPILLGDGIGDHAIGVLLLVFGIAGICGNFLVGALVAKSLRGATAAIVAALTAAMLILAVADHTTLTAAAALVLWGLGYGAVPVTFQTWIMRSAPDATEAASSLFVSVFNIPIALGALFGGFAVNGIATTSVLWIGAAMILLALPIIRGARH